jgi:hypothetical protein
MEGAESTYIPKDPLQVRNSSSKSSAVLIRMALSEVGTTRAIGLFCPDSRESFFEKKKKKDLDLFGEGGIPRMPHTPFSHFRGTLRILSDSTGYA